MASWVIASGWEMSSMKSPQGARKYLMVCPAAGPTHIRCLVE